MLPPGEKIPEGFDFLGKLCLQTNLNHPSSTSSLTIAEAFDRTREQLKQHEDGVWLGQLIDGFAEYLNNPKSS